MRMLAIAVLLALPAISAARAAEPLTAGLRGAATTGTLGPVGEGRRAWLKFNCYGCHGNNAAGGMGPNVQHAEAGDVAQVVLRGDGVEAGMRSFAGIATATDANNIAAYLRTIGTPAEPTWLDWWNATP